MIGKFSRKCYRRYEDMSLILSGYPHQQECELFAQHVLPQLKTISLPEVFNRRINKTPNSPLGKGERK